MPKTTISTIVKEFSKIPNKYIHSMLMDDWNLVVAPLLREQKTFLISSLNKLLDEVKLEKALHTSCGTKLCTICINGIGYNQAINDLEELKQELRFFIQYERAY